MRRALKIIVFIVVLIAVGIGAVLVLVPTRDIAQLAVNKVKDTTGRDVRLIGDISPSFYPVIGLSTGEIAISNADWAEMPDMVTASSAKVGVSLLPLLSGEIRITEVRLVDPVVNLEIADDGRVNWDIPTGAPKTAPEENAGPSSFIEKLSLDTAVIDNGTVRFNNRPAGEIISVSGINADAALPGFDQAFKLTGGAIWNDKAADIALTLATPAAALAGETIGVDFSLSTPLARAAFKGDVTPGGPLPAVNGAFEAASADPGAALRWANPLMTIEGLEGLSDVDISGKLAMTDERAAIDIIGGLTRLGREATLALNAKSGPDWANAAPFDVDMSADVPGLASLSYKGIAGQASGAPLLLKGRYALKAADPAAAVAWATGTAPDGLAGITALGLEGTVDMTDAGLSASARGGATRDGTRAVVDLSANGGREWATRRAFTVSLDAGLEGIAAVTFFGSAAAPANGAPSLDGRLTLDAPDLPALAAFAGAALPAGEPGTFRALSLEGSIKTPRANAVALSGLTLTFDDITARGDLGVEYAGVPKLTATLKTGILNVRPYSPGEGRAEPTPAGAGWSTEPLDFSALGNANATIDLTAEGVLLPSGLELGRTAFGAKLAGGQLDLTLRELGFYGGGIVGDLSLNGATNALNTRLSVSSVRLLPMLTAVADMTSLEGSGDFDIAVSGAGKSLDALMKSLNGKGALTLSDGALTGFNLAAMVRNVTGAFGKGGEAQKTDFSEVGGTFTITNGVLNTSDFRLLGPLVRVVGEGQVDIGNQNVNFRVTPKAVTTLKGQGGALDAKGLSFPVLITGPWHNLSYSPDLKGGIENLLQDPDAALDAVKDLTDKLGNGDAKDLIDAVKDGATGALDGEAVLDAVTDGSGAEAKKVIDAVKDGGDAKDVLRALTKGKDTPLPSGTEAGGSTEAPATPAEDPVGKLLGGFLKN